MFEDKYWSVNDNLHPSAEAEERTLAAMRECAGKANEVTRTAESDAKRRNTGWRMSKGLVACIAAALCVLFVAPAVIGITKLANKSNSGQEFGGYVNDGRSVLALNIPADTAVNTSDDYGAVFAKMRGSLVAYSNYRYQGGYWSSLVDFLNSADLVFERNTSDAEAPAAIDESTKAPSYNEPSAQYETDHSETNTQVVGVDEADVVKTDGRYIYVLNGSGVTVLTAAGENSEKVACIAAEDMPKHNENSRSSFAEMYLIDGKLVIIANEFVYSEVLYDLPEGYDGDSDDCFCYGYGYYGLRSSLTSVYVYDVSVPEEPKLVSSLCQDGAYNTSRVTGGRLYVVTDYAPSGLIFKDLPCTYVPCTYDSNGVCKLTPAADIKIMGEEDNSSGSYTYVSSLCFDSPADFSGTLALMGSYGKVYCSTDNLYVAITEYRNEKNDIRFEVDPHGNVIITEDGSKSGYTVHDYNVTMLYRISISGDKPILAASGEVMGYLLNQFSMDEYNGYFRIVTDRSSYSYAEQLDDNTCYAFNIDQTEDNALYVLDMSLNVVGSIEDLGVNEHVKSVRFMGDTGYVVTFRQIDPLFSIDLGSPSSPRILSELKIPGFSEYLHPWGSGMLLGLGQQADIETGGTQGIKLSMFDISDRTDVKELNCTHLKDVYYSAAEYDHKAILASYDRGIIGFPGDWSKYLIFTYDETEGFVKKAEIKLGDDDNWYGGDMRGLYVGDCFYVVDRAANTMYVIDLNSFTLVGSVSYE